MYGLRIRSLKDGAQVLGLVLIINDERDLDITAEQVAAVQSAVDSGDIAILRGGDALPKPVAPVASPEPKAKGK